MPVRALVLRGGEVVRAGHPDPTAFDPAADHYDPKSKPDAPTWYQVAIRAVIDVDLPRPRHHDEIVTSQPFVDLKRALLTTLREGTEG